MDSEPRAGQGPSDPTRGAEEAAAGGGGGSLRQGLAHPADAVRRPPPFGEEAAAACGKALAIPVRWAHVGAPARRSSPPRPQRR